MKITLPQVLRAGSRGGYAQRSQSCEGWELVCPDGAVRGMPYHNHGDAAFDAQALTERPGTCARRSPKSQRPPCPEGEHTVRPVRMQHPRR